MNQEIDILEHLNQLTGKRFRAVKVNLNPISARLKEGYTIDEIKEVIEVKVIEWKNNEVMAVHLCPTTLFRPGNFEKYYNQVLVIKQNPEQYKNYYEQLNQKNKYGAGGYNPLDSMF